MKSFFSALSLLTVIPVPDGLAKNVHSSSLYFPLVGFFLGILYYGIANLLYTAGVPADWISLVILCAMVVFTGALHLDGLADMADGFLGGKTKADILRIMKDSATGVFGSLSLILLLLTKFTGIRHLIENNQLWILIPSAAISRLSMTVLAGIFSYGRDRGTGQTVIESTTYLYSALAILYTAGIIVIFHGYASLILLLFGVSAGILVGLYAFFKINGITGDVLGASSEIGECLLLVFTPFFYLNFFPDFWRVWL